MFNPEFPGKTRVFDGRTGFCFDQSVTVGQSYMLKLIHLVDHKIHARATGPYSQITQQPLKGRSKHGGQRVGEMEVWAFQAFGAAYTLQEILTVKSDDMSNRDLLFTTIFKNELLYPNITLQSPEIFKVLIAELQSLSIGLELYKRFTPINLTDFIKSGKHNPINLKKRNHNNFLLKQPESKSIKTTRSKKKLLLPFKIKTLVFMALQKTIGKNVPAPLHWKLNDLNDLLDDFKDPFTKKFFCHLNIITEDHIISYQQDLFS